MDVEAVKNSLLFDLAQLKELGGLKAGDLLAVDPQLYSKFMQHLGRKVKRDDVTKNMVFLVGLSAFTSEPINLFLRGESSIGKTYNVVEVLKYFPKDNLWLLGGLSPTALVHDKGMLVDENGEEIKVEEKPQRPYKTDYLDERDFRVALKDFKERVEVWVERLRNSHYLVDLSGKILVFLEAPHVETFNRLRPVLSHDTFQISYKFTDKSAKGKLQTQHVVIQGFPATIFCSTQEKYVQDLATRSFTVTPEVTEIKIKEANILSGCQAALPWKFQRDFDFGLLEAYIRFLRNNVQDFNVVVPYGEAFAREFPHNKARSMRDFKHILQLIKVHALFHCAQRPVIGALILATRQDFDFVVRLWSEIRETTETSAPGHIMKFYHEVVEKVADARPDGFYVQDLVDQYNRRFESKRSSDVIRKWIDFLADIGYVNKSPAESDKRRNIITVIKQSEKNRNYTKNSFSGIFGVESFKAWLNEVNQILEKSNVILKESFVANGEASVEEVYQKYFLYSSAEISNICLGDSEASPTETGEEKTEKQKIVQFPYFQEKTIPCSRSVTSATSVTTQNPDFLWRQIQPSEKCELCGAFTVEYEVNDLHGCEILRRCRSCFEKMRRNFVKSVWREVRPV